MKAVQPLIEIEEAKTRIRGEFPARPVKTVRVPLFEAMNRYLAGDLVADQDMPPFDKSTVDGYAVRSESLARFFSEGQSDVVALPQLGEVFMGAAAEVPEQAAEVGCVYMPTGGFMPEGFDAVIKIEETKAEGETIYFSALAKKGQNVLKRGEDVRAGERIIKKGRRLTRYDLGVLGMLGCNEVEVIEPPSLSIATTGDELVDIDALLSPGKIRDINGTVLAGIAREWGLGQVRLTRLEDTYEAVETYIQSEIHLCDILITSGGSSVGKKDYIPRVVESLSDEGLLFHGMNIKPGKPIGVASVQGKPVVLLPGNPVSTVVGFILLVGELVAQFGLDIEKPCCYAALTEDVGPEDGRTTFHMVRLRDAGDHLVAQPLRGKSGLITYIANADGYVITELDAGSSKAGSQVKVYLL